MNFLEELEWRGMLHQSIPGIEEQLEKGKVIGYIGFDPTAPSLTIGNFVQLQLLRLFQLSGHQPIVLMGGATGRIGDPSGKDEERTLKSYDELDKNLEHQITQVKKFLDFETGDNKALLVNNYDFYKEMNILDFLRKVGKTLTINYMTSKESVKKRIETGLSFTEFSYQLLQAYDFQCLYDQYNCILQMGGSDQWGNITSGTEFIRKNTNGKAYAVTTPLLTKADGSKFGKSEKGNLWLDESLTSPYEFYQFWIRASDTDIPKYTRYFTLKSKTEVETLEATYADQPQKIKEILAEELTIRVHGKAAYEAALKVSQLMFKNADKETLLSLGQQDIVIIANELQDNTFIVPKPTLAQGVNIVDLLAEYTQIVSSKSDARRAIKSNAISINKDKISDFELSLSADILLYDKYLLIENGKKNKFMVIFE
ncbi:MAG: tyrosyl-tRNA synthetase [Saprospiraceae bacterium]|jgi:tyrosyl-tRNA synthetase